jgi:transcriptional regulator with XRE-family HTH domain
MNFGEMLKALREAAGLTQTQLAESSGVPVGTIRDYEQVKRDPLLSTAIKLARGLGVSMEKFSDCVNQEPTPKPRKATAAPRRTRGRKGKGE